eukprot:scaffold289927_cov32-Tisochrysis_lutea.AAC.4
MCSSGRSSASHEQGSVSCRRVRSSTSCAAASRAAAFKACSAIATNLFPAADLGRDWGHEERRDVRTYSVV